jgi:hypothetical protein
MYGTERIGNFVLDFVPDLSQSARCQRRYFARISIFRGMCGQTSTANERHHVIRLQVVVRGCHRWERCRHYRCGLCRGSMVVVAFVAAVINVVVVGGAHIPDYSAQDGLIVIFFYPTRSSEDAVQESIF